MSDIQKAGDIIIRGGDIISYLRYKREGYVTVWSGEGKICMAKPRKQRKAKQ